MTKSLVRWKWVTWTVRPFCYIHTVDDILVLEKVIIAYNEFTLL
jgi:hypothetical protein